MILSFLANKSFFSIRVFLSQTLTIYRTAEGGNHLSFHPTTSTRSRKLRHLFAILHVRWLPRIFNRNACVYQTATRWDLPPYRITIWLIDWWCSVCLFTWWIDSRFFLQRFDMGNRWFWTRIKRATTTYALQANRPTKCANRPK